MKTDHRSECRQTARRILDRARLLSLPISIILLSSAAHVAHAQDIPLAYSVVTSDPPNYLRLLIRVGVAGAAPQDYIFDTGSTYFQGYLSGNSMPASYSQITSGLEYPYSGQEGYYSNMIGVNSLQFYNPSSSTLAANLNSPAGQQFQMGAITGNFGSVVGITTENIDGVFGAGNFTALIPTTSGGYALTGGILGQATNTGYVVAANCPMTSPTCNPTLIVGLTASLRAQAVTVVATTPGPQGLEGYPFPVSGANSSIMPGITLSYQLTNPNGQPPITTNLLTLLDTGTPNYFITLNQSVHDYAVHQKGMGDIAVSGSVLTISSPNGTSLQTVAATVGYGLMTDAVNLDELTQSSFPYAVNEPFAMTGIGFFMQNSVLYDLQYQAIGITPFLVTDAPVETTASSPFTVSATSGNAGQLGMAGVISGPGDVVVTSGGELKLSAANTYTGETIIDAGGWLGLAGPGTISQSSGVVANGTFDISGVGLVPLGTNIVVTTASAPITTLSGSGTVNLGSQTLVLTAASGTFSGTIADGGTMGGTGGGLIVAGGIETLTGASSFTGGTAIGPGAALVLSGGSLQGDVANAGWLANNGAIGGSVSNSGLLTGNGTIGGTLTIANGGTVAPGNSIGTLTVAGNVAFQPGSTYAVQLGAGGASDLIQAGGTISVQGGTLSLQAPQGTIIGLTTFNILTAAGGVSGQFAAVSDDFASQYPFLDFASEYGANGLAIQTLRSGVPFTAAAQNANQYAVAGALDTVPLGSAFMNAVVSLNDATAPAAFTALSGGIYPSVDTVLQAQSVYLRDAVTGRLRQAFAGPATPAAGPKTAPLIPGLPPTVWTQAYGSWGDGEGSDDVADVSRSIGGFVTGIDNPIGDAARIGIAGGYSQSQFNSNTLSSSGDSDNYDLAVYGGAKFGALGLRLGASYTWHDLSVNRSISLMGFSNALASSYDAGTTQVFAEAGYGIATPYADLEPFAAVAYVSLHTDAMSETGGAAGLLSGSSTQDNTFTTLGLRAAKGFAVNGGTLTASASLGWQYAFGDTTPTSTLSFEAGGSAFQQTGTPIARNAALVGAGFDFAATPNVTVGLHYAGQLAASSQDNAIDGRVSIKF